MLILGLCERMSSKANKVALTIARFCLAYLHRFGHFRGRCRKSPFRRASTNTAQRLCIVCTQTVHSGPVMALMGGQTPTEPERNVPLCKGLVENVSGAELRERALLSGLVAALWTEQKGGWYEPSHT
jgi:hypothetical protein